MDVEQIESLPPDRRRALFERDAGIDSIEEQVAAIVERVQGEGDDALREFSSSFDGIDVGNFDITDRCDRAVGEIDQGLRSSIEAAAANVREFHEYQRREDWETTIDGRRLGRRFRPIQRIGAYVPGGTAAYPSSAIMTVIPAVVAGVDDIVVTTPPGDPINDATLAALAIAGADEVYQVGGAQAIAALAYGTESIPRVRKIVGPGNEWVTAAKAAVRNDVAIDMLAGPSEIVVIADESANPSFVAADLLAQAEHGPQSPCVLVTDDESIAHAVRDELRDATRETERQDAAESALTAPASGLFIARSMSEAIGFTETFAPEHLSIQTAHPEEIADRIDSVGSIFLGGYTPVAAGDYASGTNHVLPTNGTARVAGGLSVDTFVRSTTIQQLDQTSLSALAPVITRLAEAEGLDAHAESVRRRADWPDSPGRQG